MTDAFGQPLPEGSADLALTAGQSTNVHTLADEDWRVLRDLADNYLKMRGTQ